MHNKHKKGKFVQNTTVAEELVHISGDKSTIYSGLIPQIKGLVSGENDLIANLANVSAALKQTFDFLWVGFYLVKEDELVLGPFQGPIACSRIQKGKGVCGTSWLRKETVIVDDVDLFPGHIACSSSSKSEIVVPLMKDNVVIGVLDVDSAALNSFDDTDAKFLNELCDWLVSIL